MPLIDMPLEELREYAGRNPRPDDFDSFWDVGLSGLDAVDPDARLEPADFAAPGVECFDLWFTGVGGARLHGKLLRPARREEDRPALVHFHGYSGHAGDWSHKLPYVAQGFTVAGLDCRGQGGQSQDLGGGTTTTMHGHVVRGLGDSPEDLYYRSVFLDCAQLVRVVAGLDGVDADRIGAYGGSQGGGLTLACAALEPRIKKAAATHPFLCDYLRVWEMDLADRAYVGLREFFRRHDPTHDRRDELFTRLGYIDVQHLAPRIGGEVLMATGLMDDVCPPSTQFAAFNKMKCKKDVVIYPDYRHEGMPGWDDRVFTFLTRGWV